MKVDVLINHFYNRKYLGVLCGNHVKATPSECPVITRNLCKSYVHVACQSHEYFFGLPVFLQSVRSSVYRRKRIEDRCMDLMKFSEAKINKRIDEAFPVHAMKVYGGGKKWLHSFFTSEVYGG